MNSPPKSCLYEFEGFVLDPLQRAVRTSVDGQAVRLTARAFDALHLLVLHHGQLVDKETLIKTLWPKVVVEENNLTQIIHALRQTLGEKPGEHRFIATAPGRGYQFVAMVKEIPRASHIPDSAPTTVPPNGVAESSAARQISSAGLAVTEKSFRPWLRWGVATLALSVVAGAWWMGQRNGATNTTSVQRTAAVAVLPFVNLTGDASKDYLGDGMAEELINTLAKVSGLKVPARTSSFSYKGRNVDARQIAKELGVGMIVEGSVRSADNQIRITAQLINAEDGLHLWSETYDEQFTNIFKLQDKLAREITTALNTNLSGEVVAAAGSPPTQDVEAYRLYLQGTELLERPVKPNAERALALFQQAVDRDANFARAYEGIARSHLHLIRSLQPAEAEMLAAERAARQALALDPDSASALSSLSYISFRRGRWLDMESQSQASLKLGAADALVHVNRAAILQRSGKLNGALQELRKAYELAPSNAYVIAWLALNHAARGFDAEARKYVQLALDLGMSPNEEGVGGATQLGLLRSKQYYEAGERMASVIPLNQANPEQARTAEIIRVSHAALADPTKRPEALTTYRRLYPPAASSARRPAPQHNQPVIICVGGVHGFALLGELDVAYELANHCFDAGATTAFASSSARIWIPEMRPFRQDPRFHAYLARFGDLMAYYEKYGPPDDCDLRDGKLMCH